MPKFEALPEPNIRQAYGIFLLTSRHRFIRRLRRVYKPSVHGNKAWRASYLLMDYLLHHPPAQGAKVMELGCGWGPAAVFCAQRFGAEVTGVDIDEDVFPFLEITAALNQVEVAPLKADFNNLPAERLGEEQLLIGADICFWDRMVKPLAALVARALEGGAERVVIADPGRPTFYELSQRCARAGKHLGWRVTLTSWYATEPAHGTGEVLDVRQAVPD